MAIPRIVASSMLGFVILASLLCYLLLVKITKRLEDPEIYRTAFTETDAYNRVYDEVLADVAGSGTDPGHARRSKSGDGIGKVSVPRGDGYKTYPKMGYNQSLNRREGLVSRRSSRIGAESVKGNSDSRTGHDAFCHNAGRMLQ